MAVEAMTHQRFLDLYTESEARNESLPRGWGLQVLAALKQREQLLTAVQRSPCLLGPSPFTVHQSQCVWFVGREDGKAIREPHRFDNVFDALTLADKLAASASDEG